MQIERAETFDGIAEVGGQIVRFHDGRPEAIVDVADGKDVAASRRFRVQRDDDPPFDSTILEMAQSNEGDVELLRFLVSSEVGEIQHFGGGAAPFWRIERTA